MLYKFTFDGLKCCSIFLKGPGSQLHTQTSVLTANVVSSLCSKSDWSSIVFRDVTKRLR